MAERDTKRVLLDAATQEFARLGLAGARMQAIVARAGISERMIYHHFGSKLGLYRAVLAYQFRAPDNLSVPRDSGSPKDDFVTTLRAFIGALIERPLLVDLALHEAMTGWENVPQASLADIPDAVRSKFEAARRAGAIRKDCKFEVVYLATVGAIVSAHLLSGRFVDLRSERARKALVADVFELVLRGALQ